MCGRERALKTNVVSKDVCDALGYKNPRDAIAKHCKIKGVAKCDILTDGVLLIF